MSERECAERVDVPLPTVHLFSLTNDVSFLAARLEASKDIRSLLALEVPEPTHGLFGVSRKKQVLRDADGPVVPTVLFTFIPRSPMHHLDEMRPRLVMRPQRLALPCTGQGAPLRPRVGQSPRAGAPSTSGG